MFVKRRDYTNKLEKKVIGPFMVVSRKHFNTFVVRSLEDGMTRIVHAKDLVRVVESENVCSIHETAVAEHGGGGMW